MASSGLPPKPVRSLQTLCQIEVIRNLYAKSKSLEKSYFEDFVQNLTKDQTRIEQEINVRADQSQNDIDHIIKSFEAKLSQKKKSEEEAQQKKLKGKIKKVSDDGPNFSPRKLRSSARQKKPYDPPTPPPPPPYPMAFAPPPPFSLGHLFQRDQGTI